MRATVGNDIDISVTLYVGDTPTDADTLPTLTLTDGSGASVAHGTVTLAGVGTGTYSARLEALSEVDRIDVRWDAVIGGVNVRQTDVLWIDGGYLFELHELRSQPGIDDANTYPIDVLRLARDQVTTLINEYTQTAFVETYDKAIDDGKFSNTFLVPRVPPRRVIGATVNGTAVDTSAYTVDRDGRIRSSSSWTSGRTQGQGVEVRYVYGYDYVPADLKRAALRLATQWLRSVDSQIPDRARQMTTSWGTYTLTTASEEYPTGYPDIDSVIRRYAWRLPEFA